MMTGFANWLRRRARARRYRVLAERLDLECEGGLMLDLGGGFASFFAGVFPHPERVVLLDVELPVVQRAAANVAGLNVIVADGCRLPFATGSIQATVCNSVIEHVEDPEGLAREIERVSQSYFVQTPNGGFPLETHSFIPIPFYAWLAPQRLRRLVCRVFGANFSYLESVQYLDESRLRRLFSRATLVPERAFGMTKSFYLIAHSDDTT